jgi:hypothetical protein
VTVDGVPLLLDPSISTPWLHLYLDLTTGILAPRYRDEGADPFGKETLELLTPINDEAVVQGRLRSIDRLLTACRGVASLSDLAAFAKAVAEDDYGLAPWLTMPEGLDVPDIRALASGTGGSLWRHFVSIAFRRS